MLPSCFSCWRGYADDGTGVRGVPDGRPGPCEGPKLSGGGKGDQGGFGRAAKNGKFRIFRGLHSGDGVLVEGRRGGDGGRVPARRRLWRGGAGVGTTAG
ncbi:hypothetical protein PCLA_01r0653 [Pseudomonas citronellolis]|nr:hypothetical protein PCLA_01r0653 [Pseudomonas citronellolis]